MTGPLTLRRGIFLLFWMGLAVMTLLGCTSGVAIPEDTGLPRDTGSGPLAAPADLRPPQDAVVDLAGQQRITLVAAAGEGVPVAMRSGILVSGRGEASGAPDLAILNLGAKAFASTVGEARDDAAAAIARIVEVLRSSDILERDIQTRFFNIKPRYTTREVTRCPTGEDTTSRSLEPAESQVLPVAPRAPSQSIAERPAAEASRTQQQEECFKERERVIIGYEVSNQLTVKIRDLDTVGGVIDQVIEAGGDLIRFRSINFSIEDSDALQDRARAAAIEDVMAKAEQVASLTGVKLGKLIRITDTGAPPPPFESLERSVFAATAQGEPTPIMTGELEIVVTVQALYGIE